MNSTALQRIVFGILLVAVPFGSHVAAQRANTAGQESATSNQATDSNTDFSRFAIYEKTAPRADRTSPVTTTLPLRLEPGDRIAWIGNSLAERAQWFGHFEAMLQTQFPQHELVVRHLGWSADEVGVQPRPDNFADTIQHLTHEKIDVIFVAFGFNESFAGEAGIESFRQRLASYLDELKSRAFDETEGPRIVVVSPIANENIARVAAADRNNDRLAAYVQAMQQVAQEKQVGFANVFDDTASSMENPASDLTVNGIHLNEQGYAVFSESLFRQVFAADPPETTPELRSAIADKNRQFFRRFRPLNTFYYTGGRSKTYGYLDFLPAMRNFDQMVANRDERIWSLARGESAVAEVDDSNVPSLPKSVESRGANRWMSAVDEQKAFKVDPRFEVNLFAGEEEFPDIANPIQMRWDSKGRLWVSCSTTYPHIYPGNEPNDKLVILEDTDGDGRADKSSIFADDLHIPLSFEFGDGGVYVSEQPNLTFLKDTDGDGRADVHQVVLSGFGTEDSHHSLHDFIWTPDGDLMFRESIFHHSQVETPYGPVRQQNSGWFRFQPRTHRLLSFGTYHSTNPWGVTFDDWGQHMASHPVYAQAFHALDPPFPQQHPRPAGLQAYSGVCGHQFVDTPTFPEELQGDFIKVRYKPTNRVEILHWNETPFGYEEEYVGDLLFSTNLSFIPVDLQWGPRGALYVCDWYNPIKGHAQYSLRDERRDRHSGRIWRITAKDRPLEEPVTIAEAEIPELLELLKRCESRIRGWARRELRNRDQSEVSKALDRWVASLDESDPRYRHHQIEAIWAYRTIGDVTLPLQIGDHTGTSTADLDADADDSAAPSTVALQTLHELLRCEDAHARAAATSQLRYWHVHLGDAIERLARAASDSSPIVRMEAVTAATYIGTKPAFDAACHVFHHPMSGHLAYAVRCAMGSRSLQPFWKDDPNSDIAAKLKHISRDATIQEPKANRQQKSFDRQNNLKNLTIGCIPERMLFTKTRFDVRPGQPVKLVFRNPDATDHNLVIVRPGALAEVGIAANQMAKDPRNANSDFVPPEKGDLILQAAKMIGPTRATQIDVLRFYAPEEPGVYPYVCTFPGHWVVMNGVMVVAKDSQQADELVAETKTRVVKEWTMDDFKDFESIKRPASDEVIARGMTAFVKAMCNQCHVVAGHGVNLGPDLRESVKQLKGIELLKQMVEPSSTIHKDFQNTQFLMVDGQIITGVVTKKTEKQFEVVTNLLLPNTVTTVIKDDVEQEFPSRVSPMPNGLLNVLTKDEILDLHTFVESGGYELPAHIQHHHKHD